MVALTGKSRGIILIDFPRKEQVRKRWLTRGIVGYINI
jgi:hypothetical protein